MLKKQAQTSQEGYPFKKVTQSKNKEFSKLFAKLAQGCHRLNLFIFGGGGGVGVREVLSKKCTADLNIYLKSNVVNYMYVVHGAF